MKNYLFKSLIALSIIGLVFTSCKDDDKPTPPPSKETDKYAVMTLAEGGGGTTKTGYITVFDKMPSGEISNITEKSLAGGGMGGLITFENMVFRRFDKDGNKGVHRLSVKADNTIDDSQQIMSTSQDINGSGNFTVINPNEGFYFDGAFPSKIQKFNPTTMARTGELGDYINVINERGVYEADIKFRAIGQHFLVVKEGKLFADLTYAKNSEAKKQGIFDDFFPDVYIAVIDLASGKHIKTIMAVNTKAISYVNENLMYSFDEKGNLYFICQGNQIGGMSKIVRIKKGQDEVDPNWELDLDAINPIAGINKAKFTGLFASEGRIITLINTEDLTGGKEGNINSADIWKMFSVNINSKVFTPIEGLPNMQNAGASTIAFKMDGKIILRSTSLKGNSYVNGYFELNGNTAKELFKVTEGGKVQALVKIK